jgi:hypothetical protein
MTFTVLGEDPGWYHPPTGAHLSLEFGDYQNLRANGPLGPLAPVWVFIQRTGTVRFSQVTIAARLIDQTLTKEDSARRCSGRLRPTCASLESPDDSGNVAEYCYLTSPSYRDQLV